MKGLIVVRSFNCWNWYHRQLSETVIKRYTGEEICDIHRTIGIDMSNIVPSCLMETRLITTQPLHFTPLSVWFKKSVLNELRFIEGFYHLVHLNMLLEAAQEMTSFEVICGFILTGQGFSLVKCFHLLLSSLEKSNVSNDIIQRVNNYSRWLYHDMTSIAIAPRNSMSISATCQPKVSIVRKDMIEYLKVTQNKIETKSKLISQDEWCRGMNLGG